MNFPFNRDGLTFTLSMPVPSDIYQVQNWCRDQGIKSVVLGDHAVLDVNAGGTPVLVPVPGYILTITCASTQEADLLEAQNLIGFEPKEPEEPTPSKLRMIEFNGPWATYTGSEIFEANVSREEFQAFEAGEHDIEDVTYQLDVGVRVNAEYFHNRGAHGTLEDDERHMIEYARHANLVHQLRYSVHAICKTPEASVMLKLKFS